MANRLSQLTDSNESFRSLSSYTPSPLSSSITKNAGTTIRRKPSGHKDKMATSDTTRQQKPSSKSMLKETDKPIQLPAFDRPLNQSEIDKLATRQSADGNKLSSADVQTIASPTTKPSMHNHGTKRKSSELDENKLPVSRKQEKIPIKDSVSLQSDGRKSIENDINDDINRLEKLVGKHARRKSSMDENRMALLREEIKKIIVKHNLACTCDVRKMPTNEDSKFVQFLRNRKQKLGEVKAKLPTFEMKSWKNTKHGDRKKLYKTTGNTFIWQIFVFKKFSQQTVKKSLKVNNF